jgi:predicted ester cyclase
MTTELQNKQAVLRFNRAVIEQADEVAYRELLASDFVNRTAAPGFSSGPEGMRKMFEEILRPALANLRVEIHDQVAEGDRVTTRKTIRGLHQGALLGVAPTGQPVAIDVIDIVRLRDGQYVEHWGINTLQTVIMQLRASASAQE